MACRTRLFRKYPGFGSIFKPPGLGRRVSYFNLLCQRGIMTRLSSFFPDSYRITNARFINDKLAVLRDVPSQGIAGHTSGCIF